MLRDGRIDLMSDVSYAEERTEYMLYPDMPMGSEMYYLYVAPDNEEITVDSYASLNGRKVGVTAKSVQLGFFEKWAETHGVTADLIPLECSAKVSWTRLSHWMLTAIRKSVRHCGKSAIPTSSLSSARTGLTCSRSSIWR